MYYVTIKIRKNGRRYIHDRYESYSIALKYAKRLSDLNPKYIIEICDERWNIVYKVGERK